ncbi:DNA-methyltransferase [Evansella cellulosilytica]|uniref:Methyltransferase n=1 Tax=Evansella cellulosilytica (strain ATCC 21833 / DSM 2522 / FERM P-1141 / JCM 9156 / N-4) TaxID=649639 RepID=E6TR29_EVAC2|nr:site-specific DNA-methyltransferase [Evansella cellulosilytica]ADU29405.1 DNA methylase N-4/N-6 domain protein [Evansella cellulosilytica DSM 2522]
MDLKLYNKDSTVDMNEIQTGTIDLIVTSPPYWNLIDYSHPDQLGKGLSYKMFMKKIKKNLFECMRVLKEDAFICIVVGDVRTGEYKQNGRPRIYSLQSSLIEYFTEEMDFDLFQHFIWEKFGVKKGNGPNIYGSVGTGKNKDKAVGPLLYSDLIMEHILVFRKPGKRSRGSIAERLSHKENILMKEELVEWLNPVWKIHSPHNSKHPATFPDELCKRLILLFSLKDDKVLDPFAGTGTTLINALNLGRNAYGYEINPKYIDIIKSNINLSLGYKYLSL